MFVHKKVRRLNDAISRMHVYTPDTNTGSATQMGADRTDGASPSRSRSDGCLDRASHADRGSEGPGLSPPAGLFACTAPDRRAYGSLGDISFDPHTAIRLAPADIANEAGQTAVDSLAPISDTTRKFIWKHALAKGYSASLDEYTLKWRLKRKELQHNLSFLQNGVFQPGEFDEFSSLTARILHSADWLSNGDLSALGIYMHAHRFPFYL